MDQSNNLNVTRVWGRLDYKALWVEYEDGSIHEFYYSDLVDGWQFMDRPFNDYVIEIIRTLDPIYDRHRFENLGTWTGPQ